MGRSMGRWVVMTVAAVVLVGALAAAAKAAPPVRGPVIMPNYSTGINQRWLVGPGLSIQQYAYNTAVLGRAYSQVPPWVYGYNPYPSVVNYGPVYPYYSTTPYPYYQPYPVYPYNQIGRAHV